MWILVSLNMCPDNCIDNQELTASHKEYDGRHASDHAQYL